MEEHISIATYVYLPYHTSPKFPCPNLRINCISLLSISHWSRSCGLRSQIWGFGFEHGLASTWHNPNAFSGEEAKINYISGRARLLKYSYITKESKSMKQANRDANKIYPFPIKIYLFNRYCSNRKFFLTTNEEYKWTRTYTRAYRPN